MDVVQSDLAGPAERTISRLASSYTTCGGTNQELGGLSVTSAGNIGSRIYNTMCNLWVGVIAASTKRDEERLGAKLRDVKAVKDTLEKRKRLKDVVKEAEKVTKEIEAADRVHEEKQLAFVEATERWCVRVEEEMVAINEQERMTMLAERVKGLL